MDSLSAIFYDVGNAIVASTRICYDRIVYNATFGPESPAPGPVRMTGPGESAQVDRLAALTAAGRNISAAASPSAVYEAVQEAAPLLIGQSQGQVIKLGLSPGSPSPTHLGEDVIGISSELVARAIDQRCTAVSNGDCGGASPGRTGTTGPRFALCTPIVSNDKVFACIYLTRHRVEGPFEAVEIQLAEFIATLAAAALDHFAGSEARFRSLVQNSSDVVTVVSHDGVIEYQSSSAERVFGYPPHQMVGRELRAWLHPEDADQFLIFVKSACIHPDDSAGLAQARMRHRDGSWRHVETSVTDMLHIPGVRGLVLNSRDVSERVALELQLWERAWHDPLTGLANRSLFVERVGDALIRRSGEGRPVAVVFLDLDDFKSVNDTLGHAAGDLLLAGVGDRLVGCVRPDDTVARLGGDEFALLLEDADSVTAAHVAERVISELARPFFVSDRPVHARASLGVVVADGTETVEDLLSAADTAMYVAKAHGKSRYELFRPQMRDRVVERSSLRTDLEWALQREELAIYYQPVVSIRTGAVAGFEALLRWNHPERGLIGPDQFIDLAEQSRLIVSIGAWVLRRACRQASVWRQAYGHDFTMAVNVSTVQLQDAGLLGEIAGALQESGLDPGALVLEITESSMMDDAEGMTGRLRELKELGVGLAIDDFGTGYSSLSYLRRLPVEQLKVDRSFVAGVADNPEDVAILASVINLSQILGISVVAEGVETMDQLEKLAEMGCDLAQGFNWLHPSDSPTIERWLHHVFGAALPTSASGDVRVLLADDRDGLRAMLRIALEIEDGFTVVAEAADTPETIRLAELHQPDLIVLDVAMPGTSGIAALPALRRVAPRATIVLLTALDPATVMADGGDAADGLIDKTRDLAEFLDQLSTLCIR